MTSDKVLHRRAPLDPIAGLWLIILRIHLLIRSTTGRAATLKVGKFPASTKCWQWQQVEFVFLQAQLRNDGRQVRRLHTHFADLFLTPLDVLLDTYLDECLVAMNFLAGIWCTESILCLAYIKDLSRYDSRVSTQVRNERSVRTSFIFSLSVRKVVTITTPQWASFCTSSGRMTGRDYRSSPSSQST